MQGGSLKSGENVKKPKYSGSKEQLRLSKPSSISPMQMSSEEVALNIYSDRSNAIKFGRGEFFEDSYVPTTLNPMFAPSTLKMYKGEQSNKHSSTLIEHERRNLVRRDPETKEIIGYLGPKNLKKRDDVQKKYLKKEEYRNYLISEGMSDEADEEFYYEDQMQTITRRKKWNQERAEQCAKEFLEDMFENGTYCMRCSMKALKLILKEGRFQNKHEVAPADAAVRRKYEIQKLGATKDTLAEELPKYGYWGSKDGMDEVNNPASIYGGIVVKFKSSSVKKRCTFTVGDSLNQKSSCLPANVTDPHLCAVSGTYKEKFIQYVQNYCEEKKRNPEGAKANIQDFFKKNGFSSDGFAYLEIQFHKELTTDDIESILVLKLMDEEFEDCELPNEQLKTLDSEMGQDIDGKARENFIKYLKMQSILEEAKERNIPVKFLYEDKEKGNILKEFAGKKNFQFSEALIKNMILEERSISGTKVKKSQNLDADYMEMRRLELRIKAQNLGLSKDFINEELKKLNSNLGIESFREQYKKVLDNLTSNKPKQRMPDLPGYLQRAFKYLPVKVQDFLSGKKGDNVDNVNSQLLIKEVGKQQIEQRRMRLEEKLQKTPSSQKGTKKTKRLKRAVKVLKMQESRPSRYESGAYMVKKAIVNLIAEGYEIPDSWQGSQGLTRQENRFDTYKGTREEFYNIRNNKGLSEKQESLLRKIENYRHSNIYVAVCKLRELSPGNPHSFTQKIANGATRISAAVKGFFKNIIGFSKARKQDQRRQEFIQAVMNPYLSEKKQRRVSTKAEFVDTLKKMNKDPLLKPRERDAIDAYLITESREKGELKGHSDFASIQQLRNTLWTRATTLAGLEGDNIVGAPLNETYGLRGAYEDIIEGNTTQDKQFLYARAVATVNKYQQTDHLFRAAGVDYNKLFAAKDRVEFKRILLEHL